MMGRQEYQPQLFATVNIESLVPKNHLLRKIDAILDLSFVRDLTENLYCKDNGRPSIDPELFTRMLILTFLYNIRSDRKLCEEISYNLAYRWFCKLSIDDSVPDHSSMTRIRERLGEKVFKNIFEHTVDLCAQNGLVEAKELMMDGSLIRANASLNSLEEINAAEVKKEPTKKIKGRKFSNQTHVSRTDPDSKLAGKMNEPKYLSYKIHNTVDPLARIILDTHVTSGAEAEGKICFGRLDHVESTYGYQAECLTADRGYGYGENLEELKNRGIKFFVPNFHSDVGGKFERLEFKFNEKKNYFTCPRGEKLLERTPPSLIGKHKLYATRCGVCRDCPFITRCLPKGTNNFRKRITINYYRNLQEEVKRREKTKEFRAKMGERMWKMEGLFSEAKNFSGLARARYRLRENVQIQAYMVATVQNLKKLAQVILLWFMANLLKLKTFSGKIIFFDKKIKFLLSPA